MVDFDDFGPDFDPDPDLDLDPDVDLPDSEENVDDSHWGDFLEGGDIDMDPGLIILGPLGDDGVSLNTSDTGGPPKIRSRLGRGAQPLFKGGYGPCTHYQCTCPGFLDGNGYSCNRGGCGHHTDEH